jgi:transposase InsO family protein
MMTTSRPLELLHMDLFGPVAYLSIGGSKYGLVIVDDFSCFTWVFFLQDKSETQGTLKRFLRRAQNEFELKVKKIRSDNGSEFKNLQVEEYLEEEGVKHEFSAPYTPQQNGVVERKNMTPIRDENGTDTAGYRVIPYPTLMYLSRIRDRIRVVKIRDGYRTGPGNNPDG